VARIAPTFVGRADGFTDHDNELPLWPSDLGICRWRMEWIGDDPTHVPRSRETGRRWWSFLGRRRYEVIKAQMIATYHSVSVAVAADYPPSLVPCPDGSIGMNVVRGLSRVEHNRVRVPAGAEDNARVLHRHAARGLPGGAAVILVTMPTLASMPDIAFLTGLAPTRSRRSAVRHTAKTKRPT
jgi:hypothetical protein